MAEETVTSRYVKLNKIHDAPMEEIRPGELNQPIRVPQLEIQKCIECGQPLPESYQPPADEHWTTGICGCAEDAESCWTGLFCPCVLFGHNVERLKEDIPWTTPCACHAVFVEGGIALAVATAAFHGVDPRTSFLIGECLMFSWWMCGIYTGIFRQSLQKKYHLKNSPCDPCMVHCCMHWCAICQEHREMRGHLSDNVERSRASSIHLLRRKWLLMRVMIRESLRTSALFSGASSAVYLGSIIQMISIPGENRKC